MSSRSFAVKKTMFERVKGYPDLRTGEDTQLVIKLKDAGAKFEFAKNAIVYWKMRNGLGELFKQFFNYGRGDRESGNILKMKLNLFLVVGFWVVVLGIFIGLIINQKISSALFILFFLYLFYNGIKMALTSKKVKGFFYGFSITLVKRTAYALGVVVGR